MCSSGPYLPNSHYNKTAVDSGRGRELGTHGRDKGVQKELQYTMDDSGVILSIQALNNAKITNKLAHKLSFTVIFYA
jgi:hypothetical protein